MDIFELKRIRKAIPFLIMTIAVLASCKKTVEWEVSLAVNTEVRDVKLTSAHCVGLISANRGGELKKMGFCWNTNGTPTIDDNMVVAPTFSDTSSGQYFDMRLDGLTPATTYYARAYVENSTGFAYGNNVSFTTKRDLKVGQKMHGGYIFFLDSTREHGLICAPSVIGYTEWGCYSSIATSSKIGSGLSNSLAINKECPSSAASKCLLYKSIEGEWFLPSIDEWQLIYDNLVLRQFWTPKFDGIYWSSTQAGTKDIHTMSFNYDLKAKPTLRFHFLDGHVLPVKEF